MIQEQPQPLTRYYRHRSVGAWPFSTRDHGWPISDCTAEVCLPRYKIPCSLSDVHVWECGGDCKNNALIVGTHVQGLKASLLLANLPEAQVGSPMEDLNYKNAADMLLSYQNSDGGWPTYELQRSFAQVWRPLCFIASHMIRTRPPCSVRFVGFESVGSLVLLASGMRKRLFHCCCDACRWRF